MEPTGRNPHARLWVAVHQGKLQDKFLTHKELFDVVNAQPSVGIVTLLEQALIEPSTFNREQICQWLTKGSMEISKERLPVARMLVKRHKDLVAQLRVHLPSSLAHLCHVIQLVTEYYSHTASFVSKLPTLSSYSIGR